MEGAGGEGERDVNYWETSLCLQLPVRGTSEHLDTMLGGQGVLIIKSCFTIFVLMQSE